MIDFKIMINAYDKEIETLKIKQENASYIAILEGERAGLVEYTCICKEYSGLAAKSMLFDAYEEACKHPYDNYWEGKKKQLRALLLVAFE